MAVNLHPPTHLPAVDGVKVSSVAAGLRYQGRDDLVLIELVEGTTTAATFTQNSFAAAPVQIAKSNLAATQPRALLVNMGNANAATGLQGQSNCKENCAQLATLLNCSPVEVLPFSTGVIGEQFDMPAMTKGISKLVEQPGRSTWVDAAQAIMTTDTVAKGASRQFKLHEKTITITGIAKGSGMIAPNMATMLAFIATDAAIAQPVLSSMLKTAVANSFNRITVDSDTSTNDAVTISATGACGAPRIESMGDDGEAFYRELESLMIELATSIIRDGEGASKFVKVAVSKAASKLDAKLVAESVANSPLIKTALFASDPNWGRFPMAIGKAGAQQFDPSQINLWVNAVQIMQNGGACEDYDETQGKAAFQAEELEVVIELNQGDAAYHVWTSDLSHDYVSINADYRS